MQSDLMAVTQWLLDASETVGREYFQLPVADKEEPEYRERVYCYELYHRWRENWQEGFPYSLSGEVDKSNHPLIRDGSKPDFLVHVPGEMTNLLVMEVKPGNRPVNKMVEDLVKLTRFRKELKDANGSQANYDAAYFWVYGIGVKEWSEISRSIVQRCRSNKAKDIDLGLIQAFLHSTHGQRAVELPWY